MKLYIDPINNKAYISMKEALAHCPRHRIYEKTCNFSLSEGEIIYYAWDEEQVFRSEEEFEKKSRFEYANPAIFTKNVTDLVGKEFDVRIQKNEKGFYVFIPSEDYRREKPFFLDKAYAGPCLPGKAKIKIVKDFTSYGFFTVIELDKVELQDISWFTNHLTDKFERFWQYNGVYRYEGVRGSAYLLQNFICTDLFEYITEDGTQTFYRESLDTEPIKINSIVDFISEVCYGRKNLLDIISEMQGSVAEKYAHPITWDVVMSNLDQMLYDESASKNEDPKFALEILFDTGVIDPVRVEKVIAFKIRRGEPIDSLYTNEFYKNLFRLTKAELDAAIEFINAVNKIADKRVAALIKARKIKA